MWFCALSVRLCIHVFRTLLLLCRCGRSCAAPHLPCTNRLWPHVISWPPLFPLLALCSTSRGLLLCYWLQHIFFWPSSPSDDLHGCSLGGQLEVCCVDLVGSRRSPTSVVGGGLLWFCVLSLFLHGPLSESLPLCVRLGPWAVLGSSRWGLPGRCQL